MNSAVDNHARNDPGSHQFLAMCIAFLRGYSKLAPEVVMPVVERILFVVSGVALLAGAFALFSYERTLAERARAPAFELSAARSAAVTLPDAGRCARKGSEANLLSSLPATHWRDERCADGR